MNTELINKAVKKIEDELILDRRYLHQHPEISGYEFKTAEYIKNKMSKLGLKPIWLREPVAAYYEFDTGKAGKTLALRADIDAISVDESGQNLKAKKVCVSQNPGVCHACGDDGHTAMLLSVAKIIVENKDKFCGKFIFFFESAEEGNAEADCSAAFREVLRTKKADAVWGIHLAAFMDIGAVSVQAGPRMASPGKFEIKIIGRGGHGSRPDLAVSPIVTAAEIVCKLQSIVGLHIPPNEISTLAVTGINGGNTWNTIPDTCTILGNIRCCSDKSYKIFGKHIKLITETVCAANGCKAEFIDIPQDEEINAVNNDPEISKIAEAAVDKILYGSRVNEGVWMASESFGSYQKIVPGVFAFVGIRNEELGSGAPHHNAKFDMDESALAIGVKATLQFASDYLGGC